MAQRQLLIVFSLIGTCAIGCARRNDSTEIRQMDRPVGGSAQRQANAMEDDILAIMRAPTPAAEADAIRRLHRELSDKGMTYTINTIRTYDNVRVNSPSVGNDPVRAEVTIFRGRDVVRTFNFVPQDNRNLALLGE
jgi:hypothetical protein